MFLRWLVPFLQHEEIGIHDGKLVAFLVLQFTIRLILAAKGSGSGSWIVMHRVFKGRLSVMRIYELFVFASGFGTAFVNHGHF